ncbi:MAG: 3D domain-containing protein [Bacillota bacterium]|nr:3D domain-containing protein [Bacillota bacterium]
MNQKKTQFRGKLRLILMLLAFVIVGVGFTTMLTNEVTLVYDGESTLYNTTSNTVKDFLAERNIKLVDHIYLSHPVDTAIENGMKLTVRSPKNVIILDNGEEKTIKTGNIQVSQILKEYGYVLKERDYTIPKLTENIKFKDGKDPLIIINRVYEKVVTEVQSIPFEEEIIKTSELLQGEKRVRQEGKDGSKVVKTGITVMNGVEIESHLLEEKIVNKAKNKIVEVGTKANKIQATNNKASSDEIASGYINGRRILKVLTMNASAYDASYESNGSWGPVTAMGTNLRPGVVAVDKTVIPLGSTLYIESMDEWPSYGMASAEDTGGAIKGNKIDLFFQSRQTVMNFGRRNVKVYVLE